MKKLILLLFPTLVFGADKDYYHTKINDADVYIMSLKSFERGSNILIYDSKKANEDEYNYFFNKAKDKSAETAKTILAPYKDKIKLFTKGIINNEFKEITAVPAYGHTPGHSLINIKDKILI